MKLIEDVKGFFCIEEFVDERTYNKWGESSWQFIDADLLRTILFIRVELDRAITINNWKWGGRFSQRGLRTNVCQIVKGKTEKDRLYLSAHIMGKAIDFDVKGYTAEEVRYWLSQNESELPCKIRLEHKFKKSGEPISWVHLDVFNNPNNAKIKLCDL